MDLLMLQSNLYRLESDGTLVMNPLRPYATLPAIKLGHFFQKVRAARPVCKWGGARKGEMDVPFGRRGKLMGEGERPGWGCGPW